MWIGDQLPHTRVGHVTIYHLPGEKIDKDLPLEIGKMTNNYNEAIVVDGIAYSKGKIWKIGNSLQNKNLLDSFKRPKNPRIIEKRNLFKFIPGISGKARMISTQSPKGCVVPLSIDPVVFLQITGSGLLLSNGTVFIDSDIFETEAESFQIFRDGDSWILNLTTELGYSYVTLYPGLYRVQRSDNPFGCRVSKLREVPQSTDVYVDNCKRVWVEEKKVFFENCHGTDSTNLQDLQFARLHGDKKAYVSILTIKQDLEVGKWWKLMVV